MTCVPSMRTLRMGCRVKFQNSFFEKDKGGFVPRRDHQYFSVDYNASFLSLMRHVIGAANSRAEYSLMASK